MVKKSIILLGLSASLLLYGCSKLAQQQNAIPPLESTTTSFFLKSGSAPETQGTELNPEYFVGEKDLQAYLKFKRMVDESRFPSGETTPVLDDRGNTIMYAINYPEGWELIAADKRCPTVLACNNEGQFVFEEQAPPIQYWLTRIGKEVQQTRSIVSYDEVKSWDAVEKMEHSVDYWKKITADPEYIGKKMCQTRTGIEPPDYLDGHWECSSVIIDTIDYHFVDHLIQTHWEQGYPYNSYCPFQTNDYLHKAPAGCVAIAGAQVANYLHGVIGRPVMAPLDAFCDAMVPTINGYYQPSINDPHMNVSNISSVAWSSIPTDTDACAKLIAQIGISVGMYYGNYGSGSHISTLGQTYFLNNEVSSSYSSTFNQTALINSILSNSPVIAEGYGDGAGWHAFIIDAYEYAYRHIYFYYVWVSQNPEPGDPPTYYDDVYVTEQNISMNGGLGASNDTNWYGISGSWPILNTTVSSDSVSLLYGFSAL